MNALVASMDIWRLYADILSGRRLSSREFDAWWEKHRMPDEEYEPIRQAYLDAFSKKEGRI